MNFPLSDRTAWTKRALCSVILAGLSSLIPSLQAVELTWNMQNASSPDGEGAWNTSDANWSDTSGIVSWDNSTPASAIFGSGGIAGTVTINNPDGVKAAGITFNAVAEGSVYTIDGNGPDGTLHFTDGATITNNDEKVIPVISAPLAASGKVTLAGSRLSLSGPSFAGHATLDITANEVLIGNAGALEGLSTINLLQGNLTVRVAGTLASGITLNIYRNPNGPDAGGAVFKEDAEWAGNVVIHDGFTAMFRSDEGKTVKVSGNISEEDGAPAGLNMETGTYKLILTGSNSYTGSTSVAYGMSTQTLQIGDGGTKGSLSPESTIKINETTATLAFNRSDTITQGVDFGKITGQGGKVKQIGPGTVIFTGSENTYTGGTTVSGGTLLVDETSSVGPGPVVVESKGVLGGSGTIRPGGTGSITVKSGGVVAPGAGVGTLTLNGEATSGPLLTMEPGASFAFELSGNGRSSDEIDFWNYAGGTDFVPNGSAINLVVNGPVVPGNYKVTLFKFYSDGGSSLISPGITRGLVVGTLGRNIRDAKIIYGQDSIDLQFTLTR